LPRPVPWRIVLLFAAIVIAYESPSLFTGRVDFPGQLAFNAFPWKASSRPPVHANTGIVFTQLGPWTETARRAILSGEWPLWNRNSASGMPLAANQQTAIAHPFTLAGIFLPIGYAFTLSACLRLFFCLFFSFLLFREWVRDGAAIFGAIAYTFCTFHVVWLLFPHSLVTTALPAAMVGAQELARERRLPAFLLLTLGLGLMALGGQPETAFWSWLTVAAWCVYLRRHVVVASMAFILAAMLTAFFWMPTVALMPRLGRFEVMRSRVANPPNHRLGYEWLLPLLAPNIHGTPQQDNYQPPTHRHPAVLDDYGEIASGYAGIAALTLAFAAVPLFRRRPVPFFLGLMLFALLTFGEAPLWREAIRAVPLAGITMHQRLRVLGALGTAGAATIALDALPKRAIFVAAAVVAALLGGAWLLRPAHLATSFVAIQAGIGVAALVATLVALECGGRAAAFKAVADATALQIAAITLLELAALTWRYNPSCRARDVYPRTPSIRAMQTPAREPYRIAALGWSLLPDTPGAYGLEDVKTTDPILDPRYMRILRGYLHAIPNDYDQVFSDTSEPFFDFLNIRYVYAPPDLWIRDPRFALRHLGSDGAVFENLRVMPRYHLVQRFLIEPSFDGAIPRMNAIRDFSTNALVDHIPPQVLRRAPGIGTGTSAGGTVRVVRYTANRTVLEVESYGWSLLTTSDAGWPGWRAYWNGKREPVVTVNATFLGVFIPPGRGTLELRYRPEAFVNGVRVSAVGVIVVIFVIGYRLAVIRRRARHPITGNR
jgi:hypothetical protein